MTGFEPGDRDPSSRQVLLVLEVSIRRHEDVEAGGFGRCE
jgi:hypothetical protein